MKEYDASTKLWDEVYSECELEDLTGETLHVEPTFDACLELFAKHCRYVLDYGCGTGDILFQCKEYGYLSYGLGIDRAEKGIEYANQMVDLNHYRRMNFQTGDTDTLSELDDESFDGIILSNVLDVMPKEEADRLLSELTRVLKKDGYLFLKLNPYFRNEDFEKLELVHMKDNLFTKDNILRFRRLTTAQWEKEFEKDYLIERYLEFPYPWQEGMNRLFLLQKK